MAPHKINDPNTGEARQYLREKFRKYKRSWHFKSTRRTKSVEYWLAAAPERRPLVAEIYADVCGGSFPTADAEKELSRLSAMSGKVEFWQGLETLQSHLLSAETTLARLKEWKEDGTYQEGVRFYEDLKLLVEEGLVDDVTFSADFAAATKAEHSGSKDVPSGQASAEFEAMLGMQQEAKLTFHAYHPTWGEVDAKLDEAFRAGLWTSGSAEAKLKGMELTAGFEAAVAIGAQLDIEGDFVWKRGDAKLTLEGEARVFAGGDASASGELKVCRSGLKAALAAEAFLGLKASAAGSVDFTYGEETILGLKGEASVTVGAGASFDIEISVPIFGPTKVVLGGGLTLGIGTEAKGEVELNFNEAKLAAANEFKRVVYLPTLAQGYKMELITQDARNLYYLNKCITHFADRVAGLEESIEAKKLQHRKSPETTPLLMKVD